MPNGDGMHKMSFAHTYTILCMYSYIFICMCFDFIPGKFSSYLCMRNVQLK